MLKSLDKGHIGAKMEEGNLENHIQFSRDKYVLVKELIQKKIIYIGNL